MLMNYRDCLDIVERAQLMDLSDLSGINAGVVTIPSYVEALVTLTALQLQIENKPHERLVLIDEITKIVHANAKHESVNSEIHTKLCEMVSKVSKPNSPKALRRLLPILDKILKGQESVISRNDLVVMIPALTESEDFIPRSDLERAFIQARYLDSMHLWRKGTTELMAGKVGQATGFYLAMARTQCLDGHDTHAEATLDAIWELPQKIIEPPIS